MCLKVHISQLDIDQSEIVVSNATVARLTEKSMETFDYPLTFKLCCIYNGLSCIATYHTKSDSFNVCKMLNNSQNHINRQLCLQLLKLSHLPECLLIQSFHQRLLILHFTFIICQSLFPQSYHFLLYSLERMLVFVINL